MWLTPRAPRYDIFPKHVSGDIIKQLGSDPYLVEIGIASLKARGKWTLFCNGYSPADEFPVILSMAIKDPLWGAFVQLHL